MYKITQKPSPNKFTGRNGQLLNAIVHHRMVGFLSGTDTTFANSANQVSSHFGIGYRSGVVEISQYVDLSDSAWCNGNYDVSGGWPLVKRTSTGTIINPNYYTISIEHEDGGPTDGVVTEPVLAASLWLVQILLTGNPLVIRGAGISMRTDDIADQLKNIVPGTETLIDHHRISGNLKPDCWRPFMKDTQAFIPGWQPRLIKAIGDSSMAIQDTLATLTTEINALQAAKDAATQAAADQAAKVTAAKNSATTIANSLPIINANILTITNEITKIKSL